MNGYLYLIIAIVFETMGTSALKVSEQFTKLIPSVITIIAYGITFFFLSLTLKTMPVGLAYGIWSGAGIVLITIIGFLVFKQVPDLPAIIGLLFIIAGVLIINIFSRMNIH